MKYIPTILLTVAVTFLATSILWFANLKPRGEPIQLIPPKTAVTITAYIDGAIKAPGTYTLEENAKVIDLISAAGGFCGKADKEGVDLTQIVEDGELINIRALATSASENAEYVSGCTFEMVELGMVNINTADVTLLQTLPGIGPSMAERIIEYRNTNGGYKTIEDLQKVSGIGPTTYSAIQSLIFVDTP